MQWLINIITALFDDRHRYFDRGDPLAFDFVIGDLLENNIWHGLKLSDIIPANTVLVLLRVVIRSTVTTDVLNFRTKGNASVFNVVRVQSRVANIRNSLDVKVAPDVNGEIEYKLTTPAFNLCNITVAGWWLE